VDNIQDNHTYKEKTTIGREHQGKSKLTPGAMSPCGSISGSVIAFLDFKSYNLSTRNFLLQKGSDFMKIIVRGRHLEVTEAIKNFAEEKVQKLEKYFDHIDEVEVVLSGHLHNEFEAEAIAKVKSHSYIVKTKDKDLYNAISESKSKLKDILVNEKNKIIDSKRAPLA
jgi:putative sigma-54 modulation protein